MITSYLCVCLLVFNAWLRGWSSGREKLPALQALPFEDLLEMEKKKFQ